MIGTTEPRVYRPRGRLIILESPNPMDVLQGRSEAQTLASACRLIGFETASYPIRSAEEFKVACDYVATISQKHDTTKTKDAPLIVHISCHGDETGLNFGVGDADWDEAAEMLRPLCRLRNYEGPCILSISACCAGDQKITNALSKSFKKQRPPAYLFVTAEESVHWDDAIIAWSALYYRIGKGGLGKKVDVMDALNSIKELTGLSMRYHRWDEDESKYRTHTGKVKEAVG